LEPKTASHYYDQSLPVIDQSLPGPDFHDQSFANHGRDAPYNWSSPTHAGGTRTFSTKERPWALLGGHGRPIDEFRVLINGVSPIGYDHGVAGRDWTYTLMNPVGTD
jgi:hypothetical protein